MEYLVYYLILKPLSYLPFRALYFISDFIYLFVYKIFGYRRPIVLKNLKNSFPQKSEKEIQVLMGEFYHHLCDLFIESIKLFSISKEHVIQRFRITNKDFIDQYYNKNQSCIIAVGHYNNWEMAAVACPPQMSHKVIGIYAKMKNEIFNKIFLKSRSSFGMKLVKREDVSKEFKKEATTPTATVFAADQSPGNYNKAYWTKFLNQDTAVVYGIEKYAKEYNFPVVFGDIQKVKRGYYEITFSTLEDKPVTSDYGRITEVYAQMLEKQILALPQYWLWTHKRWKHKKPVDRT